MLRGVFVEGAVARFELAVSGHEPNELTITLYCIMLRFCLICLLIKGAFFQKACIIQQIVCPPWRTVGIEPTFLDPQTSTKPLSYVHQLRLGRVELP